MVQQPNNIMGMNKCLAHARVKTAVRKNNKIRSQQQNNKIRGLRIFIDHLKDNKNHSVGTEQNQLNQLTKNHFVGTEQIGTEQNRKAISEQSFIDHLKVNKSNPVGTEQLGT